MKLSRLIFPALMFASTSAAAMEGDNYVSLKGGITSPLDLEYIRPFTNNNVKTEYDRGLSMSGALGHQYSMFRVEVEGSYQKADVDLHDVSGSGSAGSQGESSVAALMMNGYFDVPLDMSFRPCVGAGVGGAYVQYDNHRTAALGLVGGDEFVFAYQGMAGVAYDLTDTFNVNLEYRIFRTNGVQISANKEDVDFAAHSLMLGLEYRF